MRNFSFLLIILLPCLVQAQSSVFQDGKGEAAYKFFGSGITVNTKNESVKASINTLTRTSLNRFKRTGFNLELAANEGLSNLKSDKGFQIDGEMGIYKGWKISPPIGSRPGWAYEYYGAFNLLVDRNKLFRLENAPDNRVYSKGFFGWKAEAGIFGYSGKWLMGGAVNAGRSTNAKDIKQKTVSTLLQRSVNDSILVFKEESAFDAETFKGSRALVNVNADFSYPLNSKQVSCMTNQAPPLFLAFHFRYRIEQFEAPTFNPGIGLYAGKIGDPTGIVFGFNIQAVDLFNVKNEAGNAWKRTALNFVAGYSL